MKRAALLLSCVLLGSQAQAGVTAMDTPPLLVASDTGKVQCTLILVSGPQLSSSVRVALRGDGAAPLPPVGGSFDCSNTTSGVTTTPDPLGASCQCSNLGYYKTCSVTMTMPPPTTPPATPIIVSCHLDLDRGAVRYFRASVVAIDRNGKVQSAVQARPEDGGE